MFCCQCFVDILVLKHCFSYGTNLVSTFGALPSKAFDWFHVLGGVTDLHYLAERFVVSDTFFQTVFKNVLLPSCVWLEAMSEVFYRAVGAFKRTGNLREKKLGLIIKWVIPPQLSWTHWCRRVPDSQLFRTGQVTMGKISAWSRLPQPLPIFNWSVIQHSTVFIQLKVPEGKNIQKHTERSPGSRGG